MVTLCDVCSKEPSKYRCPVCSVSSCSLVCSKSHKLKCAPPQPSQPTESIQQQPEPPPAVTPKNVRQSPLGSDSKDGVDPQLEVPASIQHTDTPEFGKLERSLKSQGLWAQYPTLRSQLRQIYKITLEEEWEEVAESGRRRGNARGRNSHTSRGRGHGPRNRGPWTAEKGFSRGLGKVRRWRDSCDERGGASTKDEGFMRFVSLVLSEEQMESSEIDKQPENKGNWI